MENNAPIMLELDNIYKQFGDVEVLRGITASIAKGELLTFVGPSGCGKTTLLRIIGGFTPLTSGRVVLGAALFFLCGRFVLNITTCRRNQQDNRHEDGISIS